MIFLFTLDDEFCERHDPHFTTFDGHEYAYQGEGWHTMFKDCSEHPAFEVTTKFEPRDDSTADHIRTRTVAFNVTVGSQYAIVNGLDVVTVSFHRYLNQFFL